ncbi:hypothetical protein [Croceiramulus getboli]|nr:hypothetical protein P8624_11585 [Flavobacteriaceae bacterium YJPT1-3]
MKTIKNFVQLAGVFVFIYLLASSFNNHPVQQTTYSLSGVWELQNQFLYDENRVIDTILNEDNYRQVKMYHDDRVMWTRFSPGDTEEWFGYGSYTNTQDELIETLEYGSATMMKIVDTMRVFSFELQLEEDAFTQITLDENGNRISSENYKRIK